MKVLIHTYGYPSQRHPFRHTFIEDEAHLLYQQEQVDLSVLVTNPFRFEPAPTDDVYDTSEFDVQEAKYLSIPRRRLPGITGAFLRKAARPAIESLKPDLIHTHFLYPAGLIASLSRELRIPLILTTHGDDLYSSINNRQLRSRVKESLKIASAIICVGPKLKEDLIHEFPFAKSKTETVMHSIDYKFFQPGFADEDEASKMVPDRINILCVARISKVKGLHLLIKAVSDSPQLRSKCMFHLVGPISDNRYYEKLKTMINDCAVSNFIFHGPANREQLRSWYRSCDFYVQPSISETFGITVLEALACGKPAVVTKSGGPDAIVNDQTGFVCEKDSPSIALALDQMLQSFGSYKPNEVHNEVSNRFSNKMRVDKIIRIYKNLLEKH
ncbi:MAG: glycosyltransferase [Balneolia bacterium]|nr:glycosyltransferase [Balneolia bacterium]